ncbi:hypothetical protein NKG05_04120 [Oerskovia sp. M15]
MLALLADRRRSPSPRWRSSSASRSRRSAGTSTRWPTGSSRTARTGIVAASVAYGLPGRYGKQLDDRQRLAEAAAHLVTQRHADQAVIGFNGGAPRRWSPRRSASSRTRGPSRPRATAGTSTRSSPAR